MTSSPVPPIGTGSPASSTTASSQPSSGRPILTGPSPVSSEPQATTVASVGPYVFQTSRPSVTSRVTSSGGQASPPKISSRTSFSASAGQSAARVGTVETTVISCSVSHGPRSAPLRTWERGTGTRQAP